MIEDIRQRNPHVLHFFVRLFNEHSSSAMHWEPGHVRTSQSPPQALIQYILTK